MPRPKLTKSNVKDHKVTVRLDANTYVSLKEAMQQGKISNLSEALRGMIRQRLWAEKFSKEIEHDLKLNELSEEELREAVSIVLGDLPSPKYRKFVKLNGFLEGFFSAFGGLMRKAMEELERREADKKNRQESSNEE